jgi:NAD-dependent dihydropyrimidine dehydrogenase PreA subunit
MAIPIPAATSPTFSKLYSIEYSIWVSGMPTSMYDEMLEMNDRPPLTYYDGELKITRKSMTDLPDTEKVPVRVVETGTLLTGVVEGCVECSQCVNRCPEKALRMEKDSGKVIALVNTGLCGGTACRKCESVCPRTVLHLDDFVIQS